MDRACSPNDGIVRLSAAESEALEAAYTVAAAAGRASVFVPASGAATRMFKGLSAIRKRGESPSFAHLRTEAAKDADARETVEWFTRIREFPFYPELRATVAAAGRDPDATLAAEDYGPWLEALLSPTGLGFADRPKALIPFHSEASAPRTPLHEHLAEAVALIRDAGSLCRLHFTVSPEHEQAIHQALDDARIPFEARGIVFNIDLSRQKPNTDTLAADADNAPFRDAEGKLVFRPGGHGALLENLQNTGGDLVFIKNIDNVGPARERPLETAFRRRLAGYLLRLQDRSFVYQRALRAGAADARLVEEAAHFAAQRLGVSAPRALLDPPADDSAVAKKAKWLAGVFARPLRVCAMVKNVGEPGGGPFWVRHADGSVRPQIVETSQIDLSQADQRKILESSTHFNPVDLVCGLRDCDGTLYKLQDFTDSDACFISEKSKDGKPLKALELPGLWNGSMAFWNTAFVEAPLETFNPVKTVNDLLRENHRE